MMQVRRLNPGLFTALWLLPLLALLQVSVVGHVAIKGIIPSLVLITVVDWSILRGMDEGLVWAFIAGLLLDVFSNWPFGTNTVGLVIVTSLVSLGEGTFMRTHTLVPPLTVFVSTVLFYAVALFILASTRQPVDLLTEVKSVIVPAAIYNGILNLMVFRLVSRLQDRVYPVSRGHW